MACTRSGEEYMETPEGACKGARSEESAEGGCEGGQGQASCVRKSGGSEMEGKRQRKR